MKKLYLILIITLLCGAKGYSQLLNSNNLGQHDMADKIPRLKDVPNYSDAFVGGITLNIDVDKLKELYEKSKNDRDVNDKLILQRDSMVADKAKTNADIKKLNELNNQLAGRLKSAEEDIKLLNAHKINLYRQINGLVEEGYIFYFNELDKELIEYENETGESAKRALEGLKKVTGEVEHRLLTTYFEERNKTIADKLSALKAARDSLRIRFDKLKPWSDLASDDRIRGVVYERILTAINELANKKELFIRQKNEFTKDYKTYIQVTNEGIDKLNAIRKNEENSITEEERLSAIGGITTVLGENSFVTPNISIVGEKKFVSKEHSSIYGEVKLIVGANDNDKKNTGVSRMFIPEASTFGFMTDFTFGFNPSDRTPNFNNETKKYDQRLAINIGAYYLGKKLQPDTLTNFNTSMFHLKLGLEYVIIPSALSVYFNTNHLLVTTNIANFEKYYSDANRVRSYASFGIQSLLDLTEKKDFFLHVNLGFVRVNNDVNTWLKTSDSVIPSVKLTLIKKL